jgi:Mu transposase, C-terminal
VGWDPLAQGLDRASSVIAIGDKGVEGTVGLLATSVAEFVAALIALLHPRIATIGRGDMSDAAARNRGATGPFGHRAPIRYVWEGKAHWYLPDYVAATADGRPIVIEAGIGAKKGEPRELAKLEAARAWAASQNGELWVIAAELVPGRWVRGALALYLARLDYRGPAAILGRIRGIWARESASIEALVERLADAADAETVRAAALKVAGDLLAEGRLELDLTTTVLTFATRLRARDALRPPLEPPGIIRDLERLAALAERAAAAPADTAPADRPDIDPDTIEDPVQRDEFLRRRAAMVDVLGGDAAAAAARRHGLDPRRVQQLVKAHRVHGDRALLPYGRAGSPTSGPPAEVDAKIGELYRKAERPTIAAIVDDASLHALAKRLGRRSPTRYEVDKVVRRLLRTDQATRQARAGRRLVPLTVSGRAVTTEFVPGSVTEFDECTLDAKVLALQGAQTTIRLHIGVLIDVATRHPLSVVVSPKALDQWDLRRAVLRALLPDDDLRARFGIRRRYARRPIPCVVRTDNGRIEVSRLAVDMACRTPFMLEWAPRRDGHAKPVVEALFGVLNRRFLHRITITTKQGPEALGVHDPDAAAIARGIDADRFERALMRVVFDVYPTAWHRGLHERPGAALDDALERFPVRTWQGSPDDLRRRLRRDEGTRLVVRQGISYKGAWYGAPWLADRLGTRVRIRVDEDDVRTLDAYDKAGAFLGVVGCERIAARFGRAVSRWELDLERRADAAIAKAANEAATERQHEVTAELESPTEIVTKASRRRHHGRRAAETATAAEAAASAPDIPQAPAPRVKPTLALPTAEDGDYEVLVDPADAA